MGVLVREIINFSSLWRSSPSARPSSRRLPAGVRLRLRLARLDGRRLRLRRLRRHRHGRHRGAVLAAPSRRCSGRSSSTSSSAPTTRSSPRRWTPRSSSPPRRCGSRRAPGVYGCAPMLVAMFFGLDPSWGMLLVPFIGFIAGFGWASFGIADRRADELDRQLQLRDQRACSRRCSSSPARSSRSTACPSGRRSLAQLNPLYHLVQLVRHAVFGFEAGVDLRHLGVPARLRRC